MGSSPLAHLGRILVSGGSGLLGSNLVLDITRGGGEAVAIYKDHRLELPNTLGSISCDLTHRSRTLRLFGNLKPKWVVHAAALTNVDWCETHPEQAFCVNREATRNVAIAARSVHSRLVYVSTDSVFSGEERNYSESDAPSPVNVYARSKWEGEAAVAQEYPDSLVIRTNIYGWNMQPKACLAEWILEQLEAGRDVPGFQDVYFSPILVNELGDRLARMMQRNLSGVYHVAGSESCSKYEFAMSLAKTFGLDCKLVRPSDVTTAKLLAPRPKNTSLNTDKICRVLGEPMPNVQSGLERFRLLRSSQYLAELKALGRD